MDFGKKKQLFLLWQKVFTNMFHPCSNMQTNYVMTWSWLSDLAYFILLALQICSSCLWPYFCPDTKPRLQMKHRLNELQPLSRPVQRRYCYCCSKPIKCDLCAPAGRESARPTPKPTKAFDKQHMLTAHWRVKHYRGSTCSQDIYGKSVVSVTLSDDNNVFLVVYPFFFFFWIKSAICKPVTANLCTCHTLPNFVTIPLTNMPESSDICSEGQMQTHHTLTHLCKLNLLLTSLTQISHILCDLEFFCIYSVVRAKIPPPHTKQTNAPCPISTVQPGE